VVDVSGDSLSTFASEHELGSARRPSAERRPVSAQTGIGWHRVVIAVLSLLVLTEAALVGWWWRTSGLPWPAPAPTTGVLSVTSEPPGAAVSIDGVMRGTTPLNLEVDGGSHQLRVGSDPAAWTQALVVRPGVPATVHLAAPAPLAASAASTEAGTLEITTEPAGLPVAVDNIARGMSPISVTGLEPGTHEVAVLRGTTVVQRTVSVEAGVPTAVLISTTTAGIPSGWLTVTGPVPVRIEENGTLIGSSDTPRLLVTVGRHELDFVNDTFGYRVRRTVQISSGQAAAVALEPATGTLSVNAQPWGEVWIDGTRIGETPVGNLQLPIGNHDLVIRHPQLGERRRTVAVSANVPARVGIDLRQ
jgi:hypothetical protein